jgi:pSer/pThr/pTyr-binding forkhead associated (FHA) protein
VHVLSADAPARAAHLLAGAALRGEVPAGHLDAAPLPPPQSVDVGPARLQFRGQTFLLPGPPARPADPRARPAFTVGHHSSCDLVFDTELYPAVATRHCEIAWEHRQYVLRDRGGPGTLVNDHRVTQPVALRPGDWIRLGADGPLLRFLGQAGDQKKLMTTA